MTTAKNDEEQRGQEHTMPAIAHRLEITEGIGYHGHLGSRAWVAEIVGTNDHYGLDRTFLDANIVTRDTFRSARYMRTYTYDLAPGCLYEIAEHGDRRYLMVLSDGRSIRLLAERATAMARLMADGEDFEAARLATKPVRTT